MSQTDAVTARLKGRRREAESICEKLRVWAEGRQDVQAVVVVGSFARNALRMSSDVDVVLLTSEPERYVHDIHWAPPLVGRAKLIRSSTWGPVTERRVRLRSGLVVEFGITTPDWAAVPLDPGSWRVLGDGNRIVYDPGGLLESAVGSTSG